VIRGFIVDFYCAELRLALEIDGGVHADAAQAAYDDFRDLTVWVEAGILVCRIATRDVTPDRLRTLLAPLVERLRSHKPTHAVPTADSEPPSPVRERGVGG
jgi:very-short-patch-repair endonuclease